MAHDHHNAHAAGLAAPESVRVDHVGLATLGPAGVAPAGLSPPQKDESPGLAGGGAIDGQGQGDTLDCADAAAQRKRFTTLRARLALAGWVLTATPHSPYGAFTVTRWGMVRDLATLADVAVFTNRVTP